MLNETFSVTFKQRALGAFLQQSPYDWQYETVPQENACLAMKDKVKQEAKNTFQNCKS